MALKIFFLDSFTGETESRELPMLPPRDAIVTACFEYVRESEFGSRPVVTLDFLGVMMDNGQQPFVATISGGAEPSLLVGYVGDAA